VHPVHISEELYPEQWDTVVMQRPKLTVNPGLHWVHAFVVNGFENVI
jgi:hypothetical protein